MKHYILATIVSFGALNITSCGSSDSSPSQAATPSPTPAQVVVASPSPSPASANSALVGNWINLAGNVLDFSQDGTVKSGTQTLQWSVDKDNQILFSTNSIQIDSCGYEILSSGGLVSNLVISLDLACNKAGQLTYTKAP